MNHIKPKVGIGQGGEIQYALHIENPRVDDEYIIVGYTESLIEGDVKPNFCIVTMFDDEIQRHDATGENLLKSLAALYGYNLVKR